ncbi:hypothetical protein ARMGADRAFT_1079541 [Armillaria gallica]|uniref:Uncharacterized protein n=1 Tax=Armillaria gallica TaxID=47427 RepID=A0A2H3DRH0_ARMGA|nr:hypothetical protein ARMGADRAFT_1079541 [Armillaria gallica]
MNVMGVFDYEEEEEEVAEYFDYYSSKVEEEEFEDECSYQHPRRAYVIERRASGILERVKERQTTSKGASASIPERAKGMASRIMRASPNNPYGTRLNPNKFKGSAEHEKPQERRCEQTPPPQVTPIKVQLLRMRVSTQDEDIEMVSMQSLAVVGQAVETSRMPYTDEVNKIKSTWSTPISERYIPGNLIKAALSTPITIPIGELMATSTELRKQMIKELQTWTVRFADVNNDEANTSLPMQPDPQVHNMTARPNTKKPEERASLVIIKVNLGLGEKKFYVNELNKEYPILPLEEARCADTNRNQGVLTDKFSEVMLYQGTVATSAALFVGSQKVSFQMLLGRLWICGNMVSMREHVDGMYLIYEDPYNKDWETELLVMLEPWNIQTEGPIPVYFVERENIEFEGLWKLQDGESIIPSALILHKLKYKVSMAEIQMK